VPRSHYLTFWLLAALAWLVARRLSCTRGPRMIGIDAFVRASLLAFAIVVGCGLVLGPLRQLTVAAYLVTEIALLAITYVAIHPARAAVSEKDEVERPVMYAWLRD